MAETTNRQTADNTQINTPPFFFFFFFFFFFLFAVSPDLQGKKKTWGNMRKLEMMETVSAFRVAR